MTPEELALRVARIETAQFRIEKSQAVVEARVKDQTDDIKELRQENKETKGAVDKRLANISKSLWAAIALLFSGFMTGLGILVTQGGIH